METLSGFCQDGFQEIKKYKHFKTFLTDLIRINRSNQDVSGCIKMCYSKQNLKPLPLSNTIHK